MLNPFENLRLSLVQIVEDLLVAEGSVLQVTTEYLNGQEVLFSDTFDALAKQLQFAEELIDHFNSLARLVGVSLIDLDTLRESIPSQVDQQVGSWRNTARLARNGISLGATSILWSENHGKYSMYGIDFPRAFGLVSPNIQNN